MSCYSTILQIPCEKMNSSYSQVLSFSLWGFNKSTRTYVCVDKKKFNFLIELSVLSTLICVTLTQVRSPYKHGHISEHLFRWPVSHTLCQHQEEVFECKISQSKFPHFYFSSQLAVNKAPVFLEDQLFTVESKTNFTTSKRCLLSSSVLEHCARQFVYILYIYRTQTLQKQLLLFYFTDEETEFKGGSNFSKILQYGTCKAIFSSIPQCCFLGLFRYQYF